MCIMFIKPLKGFSTEEVAYKALLPPHFRGESQARGYTCSDFFGVFEGFMGLRFICLSCVVSYEVRGHGSGVYCCV